MPHLKTKIILNPNADLGRAWRQAADLRSVIDEFGGADWSGTVYPTHATELALQAARDGYKRVIAAGGDGTVHEVVNGLMQVPPDQRPQLGIIPMGSGNDFAHSVGIDLPPPQSLRSSLNGRTRRIDIGVVKDNLGRTEYFDNTVGIGFDATVTIRSRRFPYLRGFLIYLVAVLQTIILNHDAPHLKINSDQESWSENTLMLVLCNGGREGGGFHVAPQARNDDGILHYTAIRHVSRSMMLRLLPEVMGGTHGRFAAVRMGVFKKLELESTRPLLVHIDGEIFSSFGVDVRQIQVELIPSALEVLCPA